MHIIRKPIIVNGKRVGPNKAMQAVETSREHRCDCTCNSCKIHDGLNNAMFSELIHQHVREKTNS